LLLLFVIQFVNSQPLQKLPLREIQIEGWMKNQLTRDITTGYISVYDELQPTMQMNVFGPKKPKITLLIKPETGLPVVKLGGQVNMKVILLM